MKSFKDYRPHPSSQASQKSQPASSAETVAKGETAEQLTKKLAAAWGGKSSGAMLKEILTEAERNKRAGKLSNEEIDEFYKQFSPMVNGAQRIMLKKVVEKLKEI